jgi:glycosyltransferase involved in cell wall biosynthesis
MRIGLYTSSLPEPDRKPGGVDIYVDRLAERLTQRGHSVTVFTYSPPVSGRSYAVHQLRPAEMATSKVRRLVVAPARINALDTRGLDVLHLHGDDWFYVRRRLPTIRTFHGSALYEARYATRARRRVTQYAVYPMEVLASRLATASYGIIPGDGPGYRTVGHLSLGIELPELISVERPAPPTVLFVGTWHGRKRGRLLHEAFQRGVLPRVPDARLIMVSDHCEPGPNVRWVRRPTDAELVELYRGASVFCTPSIYEGFGLPYLEAMAHGTPVIATSNPGSRYVLGDGRHGVIAADDELAGAMVRLLSDENERRGLGRAGRRRAEEFGWESSLERHEDAYGDTIARFRRARSRH